MKIVIAEDELPAARGLTGLLARVMPSAEVITHVTSAAGLVAWIADHEPPDLLLADIELADGRVFGALERIGPVAPIIFTTAYDQFLLDAFRAHGIAYLLKPIGASELAAALAKYDELRRGFLVADRSAIEQLAHDLGADRQYRRHFTVKIGRRIHLVPVERIAMLRLGAAGLELVDTNGTAHSITANASLGELELELSPRQFFRINRSEIIRLDAIDHLDPQKDRILVGLRGSPTPLAVAVHRTAAFRAWVGLS